MATLAFVLFWVAAAAGVTAAAMLGTRARRPSRPGRRSASGTTAFVAILVVLGIGGPVALLLLASGSDEEIATAGVRLDEQEARGREVFSQQCKNCHTLKATNASAKVGPDLDERRPNEALVLDAVVKGRASGNGQMASGLATGSDAEAVAAFVARVAGRG